MKKPDTKIDFLRRVQSNEETHTDDPFLKTANFKFQEDQIPPKK